MELYGLPWAWLGIILGIATIIYVDRNMRQYAEVGFMSWWEYLIPWIGIIYGLVVGWWVLNIKM